MKAQKLAFVALALALAFALNFMEKSFLSFGWLNGGSIMISLIPLCIVAIRYGVKTGVMAGFVYGLLSILFGGTVIHPFQIVLDYLLAFSLIGIVGYFAHDFSNQKGIMIGISFALLAMTASFVTSGVVFFAEYAPVGQSAIVYSLIYNLTYIIPTAIIAITVTPIIGKQLQRIVQRN